MIRTCGSVGPQRRRDVTGAELPRRLGCAGLEAPEDRLGGVPELGEGPEHGGDVHGDHRVDPL